MFDWNDLRHLLAVADGGSFAAAARELDVTHTTVARRIAALEESLGATLIVKGGERIALTEAGARAVASALQMRALADSVARGAQEAHERIAGTVRVTLPDTLAGYLVRQLPLLRAEHPDLLVNVLADVRAYDLLAGEADIALRVAAQSHADLVERRFGPVAWSVYASSGYLAARGRPATLEDYRAHDLIGYDGAAAHSPGGVWFRENLPDATFALRANGIPQIFNAALFGAGITLLPCFMADPEPMLVRLVPEAFSNRRLRMLVPAELARVPRVRAVLDFLAGILTRDVALFAGTSRAQPG